MFSTHTVGTSQPYVKLALHPQKQSSIVQECQGPDKGCTGSAVVKEICDTNHLNLRDMSADPFIPAVNNIVLGVFDYHRKKDNTLAPA